MLTKYGALSAAMAVVAVAQQFVMYTPGGDDTAVERIDRIISPGTIAGHVHQLFGSGGLSNDMTFESLLKSDCTTVGAADGSGNSQDHSVYWHPALYAEAVDGSGLMRIPTSGHKLYYRDAGNSADQKRSPFEFPDGFRMVAGDMTRRVANQGAAAGITQWFCHGNGDKQSPGFPSGIADCPSYPGFNGAIHFPHCWNGQDFDQSNPNAHMSYPEGDPQQGPCPTSHPIRLPHIFIENQFDLHSVVGKFKPDTFVLAQGDPTGYGWHMDFFNGWEHGAIPSLMTSCTQGQWGNADVGQCGAYKGGSPTKNCKLQITYKEEVDNPGQFLPGCNPVTKNNPAPKNAVAALGVCTNECGAAGNPPSYGGTSPSPSPSTPSPPAYSPPAPAIPSESPPSDKPAGYAPAPPSPIPAPLPAPASPPSYGPKNGSNDAPSAAAAPAPAITQAPLSPDVEWVTKWVTVTMDHPKEYYQPRARGNYEAHLRKHVADSKRSHPL